MMLISWFNKCRPSFASPIGWLVFQLGLFLLPSSALLAGVLLLVAMVEGSRNPYQDYFTDKWNWPFFIAGVLMVVGSLQAFSSDLAWVGLGNWLPFFWAFWSLQPYLRSVEARRRSACWLVAGTVPVVITGFGQIWFAWEGPWQLFGGLIIWFIAPGGEPIGRLSGLFDYANIAGAWLVCIWPLSLAALLQPGLKIQHRTIVFILATSVVGALVLTDSRNAWGGLILALPFVIGPSSWIWLLPFLLVVLMPVLLAVLPGVPLSLQQWARSFVPEQLWTRLNDMRYMQRSLASTRLSQWQTALRLVGEHPFFGWGAAAFSVLYPSLTGQWHGHAHNLPLEMAVSHGLPATILVVAAVLSLLIISLRRGAFFNSKLKDSHFNNSIFDRAWWTSLFVLVVLHGTDIPLFDSRLNLVGWILLAGLRCMILTNGDTQKDSLRAVS